MPTADADRKPRRLLAKVVAARGVKVVEGMTRRMEMCPLHTSLHLHLERWQGGGVAGRRGGREEGWWSMEFATLGINFSLGLTLLIKKKFTG